MRFSRLPARAAPAEVGSLGAWAACGCWAQTGRVLPYGAAGTCSQQPCEGSDACHRGRPCPLPRVVPWVRVCLAGHFLLPVAVKGGVGGGFTAQQGWCPCAPPHPSISLLSLPLAHLTVWAHAGNCVDSRTDGV